jgi:hypothetical protein
MALARIRHYSLLVNSRKMAELENATITWASGDELAFGDAGVIGVSDGAGSTQLHCEAVVPVSGMSVTLEDALQNKQNVTIQLGLINGQIWEVEMRTTTAEYKTDTQKGRLDGTFTFIGGEPTRS